MPVPRLAMLAADASVWIAVSLPGLVTALPVAAARFDLSFAVSPLVALAVLLVALVTVSIGTLDVPAGGVPILPFAALAAWAVAGLAVTYRIMSRRV